MDVQHLRHHQMVIHPVHQDFLEKDLLEEYYLIQYKMPDDHLPLIHQVHYLVVLLGQVEFHHHQL